MSSFLQRTIYGFIFAVAMLSAIWWGPLSLLLLLIVVLVVGTEESILLGKALKLKSKDKWLIRLVSYAPFALASLVALGSISPKWLILSMPLILFPMLHALFSKRLTLHQLGAAHWFPILFVALPTALMLFFYDQDYVGELAGAPLLLGVIVSIWINDIFAYLVGMQFGKHRLFERVSPKKSWEGSIGGLFFTLLATGLFAHFTAFISMQDALSLAFIIVVTGSLGDLIESMMKRQANVKDSGKLIPGHGGILDRFDAAFFAIPFVFTYLFLTH